MRIKVHWKLTFIYFALTLLLLLSLYTYLYPSIKTYVDDRVYERLKKEVLLSRDLLEPYLSHNPNQLKISFLANKIGRALGLRATIISADGTVIGDSDVGGPDIKKMENHINRLEIKRAIKAGIGSSMRFSTTIKKDMLYIAARVGSENVLGFVRIAIPVSDIRSGETKIHDMIVFALLLSFLIAIAASYFVFIAISKPVSEISDIAGRIAGGDFSKKAYIRSNDEIGDLAKVLNYMSDEIKKRINEASSEETKLKTVLSSMFEGIILTNEKGEILLMNLSLKKLFLVNAPSEGKRPLEVIRNAGVQDIVDKVLSGKEGLISEEIHTHLPEEKFINVNGVPIIRNNNTEGALLVFHDITELRRLEKVRQDFVANVSHELRTPISNIKGYSETLLDGAIDDRKNARSFVNVIFQDSERLAKLIEDLLDLSKIESGRMDMTLVPMDIKDIAGRAASIVASHAKNKSISIDIDIPKDAPMVLADEIRLSQVFINLLDNAVKYSPEGTSIKISASRKDKMLQTDVSDNGAGIPEKDLQRIFERFYRVDKARSREMGGTGLGLSIVKHIVQAHGGEVWVRSILGAGSTFSFTTPIA